MRDVFGADSMASAPPARWLRRLELVLIISVALLVAAQLLAAFWDGVFTVWSGARLVFAAAVARGFDVYPTADAGVVTGNMYGPVMTIFYLPALLVPGITARLLAGQAMSVAVMVLPVAVLFTRELRRRGMPDRRIGAVLLALVAVLLTLPSTRYQLTSIHADAPCLGLGLFSYVLLFGPDRPRAARTFWSAFLIALATLSKPLGAFVAAAEALLLLRRGFREAMTFAASYVLAVVALALVLPVAIGSTFQGMWLNMVTLPSRQALELNIGHVMLLGTMLLNPLVDLALLTAAVIWLSSTLPPHEDGNNHRVVFELWTIALVLVPISFMAGSKIGGDVNSFHAHYYAVTATVLAGADAIAAGAPIALRCIALTWLLAALGPLETARAVVTLPALHDNPHERVAAYLREHDDTYFPWHPLASLEARGRFLHNSDGVHSRELAGMPVSTDQFFAHAPEHPSYVVLPTPGRLLPRRFVYVELVERYYRGYLAMTGSTGRPDLDRLDLQVFRRP
jgi:Glycosyltransferase family 87